MKTLHLYAAAAVSTLLFIGAGSAQAGGTPPQATVFYGDLDLSRPAGAQTFMNRLEAAASRVCGQEPDYRDMRGWDDYESCKKDALDRAVRDVDKPSVDALYGAPLDQMAAN